MAICVFGWQSAELVVEQLQPTRLQLLSIRLRPEEWLHPGTPRLRIEGNGDRPMGANREEDGTTTFRVWAPFALHVAVAGDFNDWSHRAHEMERVRERPGVWEVKLDREDSDRLATPPADGTVAAQYQYVITTAEGTEVWRTDPAGREWYWRPYKADVARNSVLIDPPPLRASPQAGNPALVRSGPPRQRCPSARGAGLRLGIRRHRKRGASAAALRRLLVQLLPRRDYFRDLAGTSLDLDEPRSGSEVRKRGIRLDRCCHRPGANPGGRLDGLQRRGQRPGLQQGR